MTATYTSNLRLTKQATGDNSNTWGTVVNTQVIALLEDAVAGVVNVVCTGSSDIDISLTTANGATDDARHAVLELTGAIGANINLILPAVEKVYLIRTNFTGAYTITVKPTGGASGIAMTNTQKVLVYTNGTSIYSMFEAGLTAANNLSDLASASTARTNLGLGTAAVLDVGTTANKILQLNGSAQLPAVDGSLLTGLSTGGTMSSQNANNVAITGGTITGITDLALADGGTGASTAAGARTNLGIVASSITTGASGKIVLGDVTIQWGLQSSASSPTVTFGTAFSSAPYSVTTTSTVASTAGVHVVAVAAASFDTRTYFENSNGLTSTSFYWMAIGPT